MAKMNVNIAAAMYENEKNLNQEIKDTIVLSDLREELKLLCIFDDFHESEYKDTVEWKSSCGMIRVRVEFNGWDDQYMLQAEAWSSSWDYPKMVEYADRADVFRLRDEIIESYREEQKAKAKLHDMQAGKYGRLAEVASNALLFSVNVYEVGAGQHVVYYCQQNEEVPYFKEELQAVYYKVKNLCGIIRNDHIPHTAEAIVRHYAPLCER